MVLIAIHAVQIFEIILGGMWVLVALMLLLAMRRARTNTFRPLRLFGFVVAVAWVSLYYVAAAEIFSQFAFGTPMALHAIGNGLLFVSILFLLLILYTSERVLRRLGAE